LLFVALACARVFENGAAEIVGDPQAMFIDYETKYQKMYTTIERAKRYSNFKAAIARVNMLNMESHGAIYGITKFADMTPEEFSKTILMKNPITPQVSKEVVKADKVDLPTLFDWRDQGAVTAVKDQEQCGSCWAFSATEAVESAWILAKKGTNGTVDLAPQQIVDCDTTSDGCDGGETGSAYKYLIGTGGEESEQSYPYEGQDGTCQFQKSLVVATISDYKMATSFYDEHTLQNNLVAWGPLSVCVDASAWQDYVNGIMTHDECAFINILDHCVQLVGYNTTSGTPYWIVRNSWNTDWGIEGYIYLEMWHDTCGIAHDATWPTI